MNTTIALFVHARPNHTRATVESLLANPEACDSVLHVFSDGPRDRAGETEKVAQVREYIRSIRGFRELVVHESPVNLGLAASIISGVSKVFELHDRVIVLEDDLKLSHGFLAYMNQALETYASVPKVLSVSGYSYPIQYPAGYPYDADFGIRASSWGWATWKDRWQGIDWSVGDYDYFRWNLLARRRFKRGGSDLAFMLDRQMKGQINSWAIRFCYHQFKKGMLDVYPTRSLVENIGWGDDAENCTDDVRSWKTDFWTDPPAQFRLPQIPASNAQRVRQFANFNSFSARIIRAWKRWLNSRKRKSSQTATHSSTANPSP